MKTLLLLTCGTNACYHIAKLLKNNYSEKIRIVGTDINKQWMIATSPYLDAFYQSPYSSDSNYYNFILDICKQEQVDYILPSFDTDQFLFYSDNPDLKTLCIQSFGISESIKDIYQSKIKMEEYLMSIGISVPKMYSPSQLLDEEFYFVKPINGVGSKDAHIASGKQIKNNKVKDILIQEVCHQPEYTLECFNYKGKVYSVTRQRIESKVGVCTKARVFYDEELNSIAQKIIDNTFFPHIFNIQFMKNERDEFVITDVNLRTAGGMSLSYAAGWDEVSALFAIVFGKSDEEVTKNVLPLQHERFVIRAYTDIVTKNVNKRIAFDLDGTLLDSRKRHQIVMDDVLAKFHLTLDAEKLVEYKSDGFNNVSWLIKNGIDSALAYKIQTEWISKIEQDDYLKLDVLYEGVIEYLKKMCIDNTLYLLTSRNNYSGTISQIKNLGIYQFFEKVEVVKSDKAYENKALFLKNNHIDYMIGDTEVDYKAARESKTKFLVAPYGFRSKKYWKKYNVNFWNKTMLL